MDPFTLALIGGGAGALLNKKKPLQGALMGAGMGYGGGLLAGPSAAGGASGLLGNPMTAASYGTNLGSQQTAMLAAQEAGMGSMPIAGSMMDKFSTAANAMKPVGQAMSIAQQTAGMFPEDQPPPPPQLMPQQGAGLLAQLSSQRLPENPMERERMLRRQQRRGLL